LGAITIKITFTKQDQLQLELHSLTSIPIKYRLVSKPDICRPGRCFMFTCHHDSTFLCKM